MILIKYKIKFKGWKIIYNTGIEFSFIYDLFKNILLDLLPNIAYSPLFYKKLPLSCLDLNQKVLKFYINIF